MTVVRIQWSVIGISVVYLAVGALLSVLCVPAEAQQPGKIPHIGFLSLSGANQEAFRQGLRDLGYIEGKNIAIESRTASNRADRLSVLAGELIDLKVEVIIAAGSQAVRAAQRTTKSIPIVMTSSSDPVGTGFVASLARPGGNIHRPQLTGPRPQYKTIGNAEGDRSRSFSGRCILES